MLAVSFQTDFLPAARDRKHLIYSEIAPVQKGNDQLAQSLLV